MDPEAEPESDTPLQADMRRALGAGTPPVARDPRLKSVMRDMVLDQLGAKICDAIRVRDASNPLWVDRVDLADVLACERYFLAEADEEFEYSVQKARTQTAGAMLRRWAFRDPRDDDTAYDPVAGVHELLDDMAGEANKLGEFLAGMSPGGRADMAAAVLEVVHSFEEAWPPGFRPRPLQASSFLKAKLLDGRLVLSYKVGFRIGSARSIGGEVMSSVVLFDMRPGHGFEQEERQNRWLAAFLELLKIGVAPSRVVTWYAETQEVAAEPIEDDHLEAAARRVAGGVARIIELRSEERDPVISPGWRCRFCRLADSCVEGSAFLHESRGSAG